MVQLKALELPEIPDMEATEALTGLFLLSPSLGTIGKHMDLQIL